ncbi:MAG: hypothetical protein L6Q76_05905, partial [Polyangiaceae bacterium]|nr:hypothetical protein [Polyangiaceae bacterium]
NEDVTIGNNLTTLVKANDSLTVGANRSHTVALNEQIKVGLNQAMAVGVNRSTQVGAIDATMVGGMHVVMISPSGEGLLDIANSLTRTLLESNKIVIATMGGAMVTLEDKKISLNADEINIEGKKVTLRATAGDMLIQGGPKVKINP